MKYSLGPVLWYWPTATLEHFYHLTADSSADIVCLWGSRLQQATRHAFCRLDGFSTNAVSPWEAGGH